MDELRKLEKDKQLNASQRAARAREIAKKETEKLFGKTENWARVTYHRARLKIQERMEEL